ncbi:F-box protein [Pyrus ussuriensis x Pyrus communis]|uniref:F-box protein n=1 Tax=Pyrus ussuriensis x Pyrus communis TaxID=2448454 RepID=A0A5N5HMJ6_9ROSA|nr:F-box protein [Pyrus ussuriensis x Pyrus communis]
MKKARITSSPIQSLPDELLVQKLTKMVCNEFNQIGQDDHIFEHINIREFEDVSNFLKRYMDCGNSEALYMLGMTYFFQDNKKEAEIEALKMAISKDHEVATYVHGVILVCLGGWGN